MFKKTSSTIEQENQETKLDFFEYNEIKNKNKIDSFSNHYLLLISENDISDGEFKEFLTKLLQEKNIPEIQIKGSSFENDTFYIYLFSGEKISIPFSELKEYVSKQVLEGTIQKESEQRAKDLENAIESIFEDNNGIFFNGEIYDEDRVKTGEFKGLTLIELKKLLDVENKKLLRVYKINNESTKQKELLKTELKFYTGLGDKYEGGARYFSMKTNEIDLKVSNLVNSMTFTEIFDYIKNSNKTLDDNFRTSTLVEIQNTKFIKALQRKTFDKLKTQNASNIEYIKFITAISGRGNLEMENGEEYKTKTRFEYDNIAVNDAYRDYSLEEQALAEVMYRKGGVIEEIIKKKTIDKVNIDDKEMLGRSPSQVIQEIIQELESKNPNKDNYGENTLRNAGFGKLLNIDKTYKELSLDDKISIGAIARILKVIKNSTTEQLKDPNFMKGQSLLMVENAFDEINENMANSFRGGTFDFDGIEIDDLGLSGELGEIYHLYSDINGIGTLDFKDKNTWSPGIGTIAVGVGLIGAGLIAAPVLGAVATGMAAGTISNAAIFQAGAIAGAKLGLLSGISGNIFSHQGYDTYDEAIVDVSSQIGVDIFFSTLFTGNGFKWLAKTGNITPDLFWSIPAWTTKAGLLDKTLISTEMLTMGFLAAPTVSGVISKTYKKNHFDIDELSYHENLAKYPSTWENFKNAPAEIWDDFTK